VIDALRRNSCIDQLRVHDAPQADVWTAPGSLFHNVVIGRSVPQRGSDVVAHLKTASADMRAHDCDQIDV